MTEYQEGYVEGYMRAINKFCEWVNDKMDDLPPEVEQDLQECISELRDDI